MLPTALLELGTQPWKRMRLASYATVLLSFITACGIEVSTGTNAEQYLSQLENSAQSDSGQIAQGSDGNAIQLTCSGPAPDIPSPYQELCANVVANPFPEYEEAQKLICQDRRLVGLLYETCSYQGQGDSVNKLRLIHKTDLSDPNPKFTYVSAYSVSVPLAPGAFKQQMVQQYTDPNFPNTYKIIANSRISNGVYNSSTEKISYNLELNSSAASVAFGGEIHFASLNSGSIAIYDRAVKDKLLIEQYGILILAVPVSDAETRLIIVNHTHVEDDGNHSLALRTLMNLDSQRMEMLYDNALHP